MSQKNPNSGEEPKITRLPRSGPKPGQSTNSYLAGRTRGDIEWGRISPQAGYDERKGRKLGRVKRGQIKDA